MRVILEAVIAVLAITLLRSVIGMILKGFSELFHPSSSAPSSGANQRARPIPSAEALKRDPVCGTFIAPSSSVRTTVEGETLYFCSAECRDKYRGTVRKAG